MDLGTLKPTKGSISSSKRIGRGNGSGQGRTAGKVIKGTNPVRVRKTDSTLKVDKLL